MIVFSRPTYFCVLAIGILLLDKCAQSDISTFTVYGIPFATNYTLTYSRDFLIGKYLLPFKLCLIRALDDWVESEGFKPFWITLISHNHGLCFAIVFFTAALWARHATLPSSGSVAWRARTATVKETSAAMELQIIKRAIRGNRITKVGLLKHKYVYLL